MFDWPISCRRENQRMSCGFRAIELLRLEHNNNVIIYGPDSPEFASYLNNEFFPKRVRVWEKLNEEIDIAFHRKYKPNASPPFPIDLSLISNGIINHPPGFPLENEGSMLTLLYGLRGLKHESSKDPFNTSDDIIEYNLALAIKKAGQGVFWDGFMDISEF